jgi:hypothetical protein
MRLVCLAIVSIGPSWCWIGNVEERTVTSSGMKVIYKSEKSSWGVLFCILIRILIHISIFCLGFTFSRFHI